MKNGKGERGQPLVPRKWANRARAFCWAGVTPGREGLDSFAADDDVDEEEEEEEEEDKEGAGQVILERFAGHCEPTESVSLGQKRLGKLLVLVDLLLFAAAIFYFVFKDCSN